LDEERVSLERIDPRQPPRVDVGRDIVAAKSDDTTRRSAR
jgi:hypothetical protein